LDKPARERIVEQADRLFTLWGVNISKDMIAHFAHTNVDTIIKHFGTRERLVFDFLESLMKQVERSWKQIEQEHPNDPEAQLRRWVLHAEFAADLSGQEEHAQLSRAAVDLLHLEGKNPLLSEIEKFWQAERRKIVKLANRPSFGIRRVWPTNSCCWCRGRATSETATGTVDPVERWPRLGTT
jgi:hypothetical protein